MINRSKKQIRAIAKIYAASALLNLMGPNASQDLLIGADSMRLSEEELGEIEEEMQHIANGLFPDCAFSDLDSIVKYVDESDDPINKS